MGEICIRYSELEASIADSRKMRGKMDDYINELRRKVISPIENLPGNDTGGYASDARQSALNKTNRIEAAKARFLTYESSLSGFVEAARAADQTVARRIEALADVYIGKRTWYEAIGDWLYNTFCVDAVNSNDILRFLSDAVKWGAGEIGDYLEEVRDYFKYGDGKYVFNIVMSGLEIAGAIAGVILAIAAISVTGGAIALVIGIVGAAATTVGAVISVSNSISKGISNCKAEELRRQGDNSGARYYGDTESLSDYWEKHDMGDADTNAAYETAGEAIDRTKKVSDTVALVCNIASLGNVKDLRYKDVHINTNYNKGKWYAGYSFTPSNILKNLKHDMGFFQNGKLNPDKAFDVKKMFISTTPKDTSWNTLKHYSENIKNLKTWTDGVSDVLMFDGQSDLEDAVDIGFGFAGIAGDLPVLTPLSTISSIGDDIKGWRKEVQE